MPSPLKGLQALIYWKRHEPVLLLVRVLVLHQPDGLEVVSLPVLFSIQEIVCEDLYANTSPGCWELWRWWLVEENNCQGIKQRSRMGTVYTDQLYLAIWTLYCCLQNLAAWLLEHFKSYIVVNLKHNTLPRYLGTLFHKGTISCSHTFLYLGQSSQQNYLNSTLYSGVEQTQIMTWPLFCFVLLMKGISRDRDWGRLPTKRGIQSFLLCLYSPCLAKVCLIWKAVKCEHSPIPMVLIVKKFCVCISWQWVLDLSNPNWSGGGVTWPKAKVISYYSQFLHFSRWG